MRLPAKGLPRLLLSVPPNKIAGAAYACSLADCFCAIRLQRATSLRR
jgi:hypothetical protein